MASQPPWALRTRGDIDTASPLWGHHCHPSELPRVQQVWKGWAFNLDKLFTSFVCLLNVNFHCKAEPRQCHSLLKTIRAFPRSLFQLIHLLKWQNFHKLSEKFCVQVDNCGSFYCFFFFLITISHLWPRSKLFLGQTTGGAEWKKDLLLLGALMLSQDAEPRLSTSTAVWAPLPLLPLPSLCQGQNGGDDWFQLILLWAWKYNRALETTQHFPSSITTSTIPRLAKNVGVFLGFFFIKLVKSVNTSLAKAFLNYLSELHNENAECSKCLHQKLLAEY